MSVEFVPVAAAAGIEELELASNGLRVLLVAEPAVPVASVLVVYHVGSRNEAVGHTGATHLLEHLMFKGSQRFDPRAGRPIARALERVGAAFNATTWFDRTTYYETVPVEHLDLALELESDRMRRALLREDDLAAEMTVVRNEFERGENDPFDVLLKESFATAFREHPYHHPTIGWRSDIENVTIARLCEFYDTFYYPDNATLVVAGSFARDEALARIAARFGPLPRAPRPIPAVVTREPAQQGERRFTVRRAGEVGWVVCSWRTPEAAHPDTHTLAVLADALGAGVTSRLYQRLVEDGRCLDVHAFSWQLKDPGLFQVFACLNHGATHLAVEEAIRAELAAIAGGGLRAEELERAKVQVEAQTAYLRDAPAQVAAALSEAVSCASWRFYVDYPERIRAVRAEDVVRVAAATFHDDAISVGWFVPRNGAGASTAASVPRPQPCTFRAEVAPLVHEHGLANGLKVAILPRDHNPVVTVAGSLLAGHGMLPTSAWTPASLVPDMLERGTEGHARLELARTIEDLGIELDVSTDGFNPFEVQLSARCLTRHFPLVVELLAEMLRAPTFPAGEFDKLRQLRLGELSQAQEDTFSRAFEAFTRLVYPAGHPHCRRSVAERRAELETLGRDGLLAVHRHLYGPASLVLAVVGDVAVDAVMTELERRLGDWAGGAPRVPEVARRGPADGPPGEAREAMVDKPSLDVVLGHPGGLRRRDDDFLAAMLGNALLGQSTLTSRLGRRLRDREGLTYGVISRFMSAALVDGPWLATFSVAPADLERGVRAAREEIAAIVADGPDPDDLTDEREAMAGSYRVGLATSAGLARELSRLLRYRLPLSELDALPARVLAVDAAAVHRALRAHVDPDRLSLAVAGDLDGQTGG